MSSEAFPEEIPSLLLSPSHLSNLVSLTIVLTLMLGCTSAELRLMGTTDLGRAYADSSINVSIFRQDAVLMHEKGALVGFFAADGEPVVDYLDGETGRRISRTRLPRLSPQLLGNGHCVISMGISSDGHLHVLYGAHETRPRYARIPLADLRRDGGSRAVSAEDWLEKTTYPQFYTIDGKLWLLQRCLPDHCARVYDQGQWGKQRVLVSATDSVSVYLDRLGIAGDDVAVSWVERERADGTAEVINRGIYWAKLNTDGSAMPLAAPSGTRLQLPLMVGLMNQGSGWLTTRGDYLLTVQAKDEKGVPNIFLVHRAADGAVCSQVVSRNAAPFDLMGRGTLSLPLSRAELAVSRGAVHLFYRLNDHLIVGSKRYPSGCNEVWTYQQHHIANFQGWEPNYDVRHWQRTGRIVMYVQSTRQDAGDKQQLGSPTRAWLYEWEEK